MDYPAQSPALHLHGRRRSPRRSASCDTARLLAGAFAASSSLLCYGLSAPEGRSVFGASGALLVAATLVVFGTQRVRFTLARHGEELRNLRERKLRAATLIELGSRMAPAARELSAILASIAASTRALESRSVLSSIETEARFIRAQVERCRAALSEIARPRAN